MSNTQGTVTTRWDPGAAAGSQIFRTFQDPYGNSLAAGGDGPPLAVGNTTGRGFLNLTTSSDTGVVDTGVRKYDPTTGVFLSVDPVLDAGNPVQWNGYAYGGGNPVSNADPSGAMFPKGDGPVLTPRGGGGHGGGGVKHKPAPRRQPPSTVRCWRSCDSGLYHGYVTPKARPHRTAVTWAAPKIYAAVVKTPFLAGVLRQGSDGPGGGLPTFRVLEALGEFALDLPEILRMLDLLSGQPHPEATPVSQLEKITLRGETQNANRGRRLHEQFSAELENFSPHFPTRGAATRGKYRPDGFFGQYPLELKPGSQRNFRRGINQLIKQMDYYGAGKGCLYQYDADGHYAQHTATVIRRSGSDGATNWYFYDTREKG